MIRLCNLIQDSVKANPFIRSFPDVVGKQGLGLEVYKRDKGSSTYVLIPGSVLSSKNMVSQEVPRTQHFPPCLGTCNVFYPVYQNPSAIV